MNNEAQWMDVNEQYLAATMTWIRLRLQRLAEQAAGPRAPVQPASSEASTLQSWFKRNRSEDRILLPAPTPDIREETIAAARKELLKLEENNPPPALRLLAKYLRLSVFDCNVLALCAAMELDTRAADLCAKAQGGNGKPFPTFGLAFALFDDPDWNALSPQAPLRYWRLLEINQPGTQALTGASLGADERIVNYLKGLNYLDDRLTPLLDPLQSPTCDGPLPSSQQQVVDNILENLKHIDGVDRRAVIELTGHDAASKQMIAARVAALSGVNLYRIGSKTIPTQTGDFETFTRLWQRESLLMPLALYIVVDEGGTNGVQLKRFLERSTGVVFLDVEDAKADITGSRLLVEVSKPTPPEQRQLWGDALQGNGDDLSKRLADQFSFAHNEIEILAKTAFSETAERAPAWEKKLWQVCRVAARAGMEQLAVRIDAKATWEQLVLPAEQKTLLRQITDQVAQRNRVYDEWGFRDKMNRGLGINALFAGESGTGKTMAAEVIANELELDLFRIDLSAVVNKYIGETEKNLRKLFDAAEDSGAILFFDEADALFGKRSEVKDSHDRYANIEINYLLQRMESYKGLAILATNMKGYLDKAFVRRLRFIVDFPFPEQVQRKEIWQRVFPSSTPVDENLDFERLGKLKLTGGNIHNVAINAAFLGAREGGGVTMPLILNAARMEFKKLERPAKDSDFGWLGKSESK